MANINYKTGRAGNFKDLTGQRFGKLTVVNLVRVSGKRSYWLCLCDCGSTKSISKSNLRSGNTKSCGCLRRDFRWLPPNQAARNAVLSDYKSRAKKKKREWALTDAEFDKLTQSACHYCGDPPQNDPYHKSGGVYIYNGIDRKENSFGYLPNNVVSCCAICNKAKGTMSYSEFMWYIKRLSVRLAVLNPRVYATTQGS